MGRNTLSLALIVFLVFSCLASAAYGQFYKWTDKDGTVHISDVPPDAPDSSKGQDEATNSQSKELSLKEGWNKDNLDQAITGCTFGMMNSSLKGYKEHAATKGHQVTDKEIVRVQSRLYPTLHKICQCITVKIAQKFGFENVKHKSPETQEYVKSLFDNKICPLPAPPR